MHQPTPLISTIVIGLVLAFAFGALMHRLRVSPLVGYLIAGIVIGPFTPGFIADQKLANELAEIGVILLMFGVGLHFSRQDLFSVRAIAIPGALFQIALVTMLGIPLAWSLGWSTATGLVLGLTLSVASTVVVLRALQERRLVDTERGRIAVGWLIVEDIVMVFTLVLLPPIAGMLKGEAVADLATLATPFLVTLGKIVGFIVVMFVVGIRAIPWMLHYVAHTGSRELFRLAVLVTALGVAYAAATLFDVSFALGAFLAGMILSESQLSQRAASESLPLRDAFAVLFFVSVGMLFDPSTLVEFPFAVLAAVIIIVGVKGAIGFLAMRLFGYSMGSSLMLAASRAQMGEFSFILAGLGVSLALLPEEGRSLVLAAAILSILINPLLFEAVDRWSARREKPPAVDIAPEEAEPPARHPLEPTRLADHIVLVGYGRVGGAVCADLMKLKIPLLVVETDPDKAQRLRDQGIEAITGNAADPEVAMALNLANARCLLLAIPDGFEAGQVIEQAHAVNPSLRTVARAHSADEIKHLQNHGANAVIMGESLIANAMIGEARAVLETKRDAPQAAVDNS